jgi:hypothetical protein
MMVSTRLGSAVPDDDALALIEDDAAALLERLDVCAWVCSSLIALSLVTVQSGGELGISSRLGDSPCLTTEL